MKCERCNSGTEGYDLHDYCASCGKNLCRSCMADGCCGLAPAKSGMDEDEQDYGEQDAEARFYDDPHRHE